MQRLTEAQIDRYAHHLILKEIGGEGQRRLLAASALIVGAGGLGSPAALYLAAAGVGRLGLIDDDRVALSNLQRQILHTTADLDRSKVASATEAIEALNPDVRVVPYETRLTAGERRRDRGRLRRDHRRGRQLRGHLPDQRCLRALCRPFSHAGVAGFSGQLFTYVPGGPCLRCLFPEPPPTGQVQHCGGAGVVGATAGVFGSIQAAEAIKALLGRQPNQQGTVLSIDLLSLRFTTSSVSPIAGCACRRS